MPLVSARVKAGALEPVSTAESRLNERRSADRIDGSCFMRIRNRCRISVNANKTLSFLRSFPFCNNFQKLPRIPMNPSCCSQSASALAIAEDSCILNAKACSGPPAGLVGFASERL